MTNTQPSLDDLRAGVEQACQPSSAIFIEAGRAKVLSLPRAWVVTHIGNVAEESLNLEDYWEYRRLLELLSKLDPGLLRQFAARGLNSMDADIREAAEEFSK